MTMPFPAQSRAGAGPAFLRPALALLWLVLTPVLCILYLKIEPSPDQAQFDYMGWLATQGRPFYAGSFDMNWPGAMLLHEAAIRLFGPAGWSWHLLDFLLVQLAAMAAGLFLWRAGFRFAPWIVLVLYPPLYVTAGAWMAGQRDIVAMGLLIMACCAMLAPARRERGALISAGALVAFAVLIRPTYLSVLVGLLILEALPRDWLGQPRRDGILARLLALGMGFALVILAVLAWAVAVGNLDDWYQQSVMFTSQVYYGEPPMDLTQTLITLFTRWWHWLSLGGLVGLVLWVLRDRGVRYPLALLLGLACAILLSFFAQNKGFGYHIAGFVPLLAMLMAVAIDQLAARAVAARNQRLRWLAGGAAIALAGLAALGTVNKIASNSGLLRDYWQNGLAPVAGGYGIPAEDQARMIRIIQAESTPEDTLAQYGTAHHIPYLARRLPPHRFITPAIELMNQEFALYQPWLAEIRDGLRARPPAFVLITGIAPVATEAGLLSAPDNTTPALAELLAFMGDDYAPRVQGDYGALFQRVAR
ncbi:hypothetical protein SAMN04487972_1347 [Paracoccus halophilus]|uniref:4-amino-4-deoxy-L-arabinose transferase n=1 Tax=Paracoccus halophilus TaxID=376733 RepID=A0A099EWQ8_9RHOB|nr:hypothetical protein [Paracoccus halophilus]KGJ02421.1 hypothetical protein IT41_17455 [Paracoccus halophilus]SFA61176.1 hypothetical protein SAMN04487972_1347 [Paracoccus halophilus]